MVETDEEFVERMEYIKSEGWECMTDDEADRLFALARRGAEVQDAIHGQHDIYAAAREEYRKKIAEQATEIERLRRALQDISDGMGEDEPVAIGMYAPGVARAALGGSDEN